MILYLYPNAPFLLQHAVVGAATGWEATDEDPHDGDTSYIHFVTAIDGAITLKQSLFDLTPPPAGLLGRISLVNVELIAKHSTSPGLQNTVTPRLRPSSGNFSGPNQAVTGDYATYAATGWTTNPEGGNWTWATLNGTKCGVLTLSQDDGVSPTDIFATRIRLKVVAARAFAPSAASSVASASQPTYIKGNVYNPASAASPATAGQAVFVKGNVYTPVSAVSLATAGKPSFMKVGAGIQHAPFVGSSRLTDPFIQASEAGDFSVVTKAVDFLGEAEL